MLAFTAFVMGLTVSYFFAMDDGPAQGIYMVFIVEVWCIYLYVEICMIYIFKYIDR